MAQANSEFVIWGKAPNAKHESLLVSEFAGLKSRDHAERTIETLANVHGCTEMRVQKLAPLGDGSELAGMFKRAC